MISIIDYGVGNIGSMLNMLGKAGLAAHVISTPEEVECSKKIILPGVGAFDQGMSALGELGLIQAIQEKVLTDKTPILGVCLGMQILGTASKEGKLSGLGLIDAKCERFQFDKDSRQRVPHMGWCLLEPRHSSDLLQGLDSSARFYFVHSYHLVCNDEDDVLATSTYGIQFAASIQRENVYGVQFHPEKSHRYGMKLLHNFGAL